MTPTIVRMLAGKIDMVKHANQELVYEVVSEHFKISIDDARSIVEEARKMYAKQGIAQILDLKRID